jgi:type 1 glutamine amidotransferase
MGRSLLVLSGGHPFEEQPFADLLASLDGWDVDHQRHPEAEEAAGGGDIEAADAILFYDMPGYSFADNDVTTRPPLDSYRQAIIRRFERGKGAVAMHHALAGWADWPEWAEMIGGRFLYQPGSVRGKACLDSGYRHDVEFVARPVAGHPVTADLPDRFSLTDELYLAEVFEDSVVPLMRAEHEFDAKNFYSSEHAVAGRMFDNRGWDHPRSSNLIAWTKPALNAQIVYLQSGDCPAVYRDTNFRKILANALEFVAAKE